MEYRFTISYLPCQSCTAKIHCDNCAAEASERLRMREKRIFAVQMDIPKRELTLTASGMDEDDVIDLLEDVSIFAD